MERTRSTGPVESVPRLPARPRRRGRHPCVLLCLLLLATSAAAGEELELRERFVPHRSTAPANDGAQVGLYLREKWSRDAARRWDAGAPREGRVVLLVHGGIVSSVPVFDLAHGDYSWMDHLAEAGFDVFAMDFTGYGRSPRPTMDDPCNLAPEDQARVLPHALRTPCAPSRAGPMTTRESDWDELGTVVDFIRALRGVDRVSLLGWSLGGPRAGGFAARHPEKVDRLVLYSPAYSPTGPGEITPPTTPMRLLGPEMIHAGRWADAVACEDQVEPGIRDAVWAAIQAQDPLGVPWSPPAGVMRLRTSVPIVEGDVAWDRDGAGRIVAPTLILTGEHEHWRSKARLHADLRGADSRVLAIMDCATHYALWERTQYRFLHRASAQWLATGTFEGTRRGAFRIGVDGVATPLTTLLTTTVAEPPAPKAAPGGAGAEAAQR